VLIEGERYMAHELEIGEDGTVAFALRGEPAWHGLANALFDKDENVTTEVMLKSAKLNDWNVNLELIEKDGYNFVSESYMVTRTNPFGQGTDVLSVVGDRYKVVQNEELFAFGDGILDGGASWESAGSIKNGRVVFGSLVVPREFILDEQGANDKTTTYLLVHTSHDGSTAVQANITPVRVVCQNTLNMALSGSKQSFKIRHTSTVDGRIAAAREALGLTFAHMDSFETMARELFESTITNVQFSKIVETLYPKPEDTANKVAITRYDNKIGLIQDLYLQSPTNANIKGTAWGALNALTERLDYYRAKRGSNESLIAGASGFDPVVNAEKARILSVVREAVSA
jgi:phage/plasmid-like protein (TIGR03299 family)